MGIYFTMEREKKMTIGQKMGCGFGGVLFLLILVSGIGYYSINAAIDGYETLVKDDVGMLQRSSNIEKFMLQARRSEKDFLLRKDLQYANLVKKAITSLQNENSALLALETEAGDSDGMASCQSIPKNAAAYIDDFLKISASWQKKGLDENSGLQGQFRQAASELENEIKKFQVSKLQENLLEIRRQEKDFTLLKDQQYVQQTKDKIDQFKQTLAATALTQDDKDAFTQEIEAYAAVFNQYEETMIRNGLNENSGLQGDFRQAAHNVEAIMKDIPEAAVTYLTLRRHEKDYLLRGDDKYVNAVKETIVNLNNVTNNLTISEEQKSLINKNLTAYEQNFEQLVAADKQCKALAA